MALALNAACAVRPAAGLAVRVYTAVRLPRVLIAGEAAAWSTYAWAGVTC